MSASNDIEGSDVTELSAEEGVVEVSGSDGGDEQGEDGVDISRASSAAASSVAGSRVTPSGRRTKKRKKVSWVFSYFSTDRKNDQVICCVGKCKKKYAMTTSTGTLAYHLQKAHRLSNTENSGAVPGDPTQATFSKDASSIVVRTIARGPVTSVLS